MKTRVSTIWILLAVSLSSVATFGQVGATAALSGTVTDPSGAVVSGATIAVKNDATGAGFSATTSANGRFTIPALSTGTYTVKATARGFKQAIAPAVKVDAATPATVNFALEVGATTDSVVVQGGGEVLQTQSANVATTITGRQISELPFTSRDALDLALVLAGTQTVGRPRSSTINGLPKGALNITIDGVNVQQPDTRSGDGFFTWIRPRIDAIEEVSVSTATPGAESSAEGAVQIKFVTRGGTNQLRGSVYWYHRNPALNANNWFNNRDLPADPSTGKAPRDRVLLNQPGFRIGGPISIPGVFSGRDRFFYFVNYEEFRLPEQQSRQRVIFSPQAQQGIFQYNTATGVASVDLLKLAADGKQTATVDPIIAKLLTDIRASTSKGGVSQSRSEPTEFQLHQSRFDDPQVPDGAVGFQSDEQSSSGKHLQLPALRSVAPIHQQCG